MATDDLDRLAEHLKRLNLRHAANNLHEHVRQATALELSHLGFLARVAEAEVLARAETAAARRMAQAGFPEVLRLEDYDFKCQPALDRKQVLNLAELGFLDLCEAVFFIGPSGVGKTHLAIALGVRACEAKYSVRFCRAYDMLRHLYASLADDTLEDVLDQFKKPDLLIVDELGNSPRSAGQDFAPLFFELVSRRYRSGSTIICTNLGVDEWPQALGTPYQLTPSLDRLFDGAHIVSFPKDAKSFRTARERNPGRLPTPRRPGRRTPRGSS